MNNEAKQQLNRLRAQISELNDAADELADEIEEGDNRNPISAQQPEQPTTSDKTITLSVTPDELHRIVVALWQAYVTMRQMGGPNVMFIRADQYRALGFRIDAEHASDLQKAA